MTARLRLTGFLESFNGELCLLLQIQWKDMLLPFPPTLVASPQLRIPYHHPYRLPPSRLDLNHSFLTAKFSPVVSRYLNQKIADFVLDLSSAFAGVSLPSLFILAEIKTKPHDAFINGRLFAHRTLPLMPRRLDPAHQPCGGPRLSRLFINDAGVGGFTKVLEKEEEDSPDQNQAEASVQAITKNRELGLEKEVSELGECSFCLQEMSAIKEVLKTPCHHVFHAECILRWQKNKNTYPICRPNSMTNLFSRTCS